LVQISNFSQKSKFCSKIDFFFEVQSKPELTNSHSCILSGIFLKTEVCIFFRHIWRRTTRDSTTFFGALWDIWEFFFFVQNSKMNVSFCSHFFGIWVMVSRNVVMKVARKIPRKKCSPKIIPRPRNFSQNFEHFTLYLPCC